MELRYVLRALAFAVVAAVGAFTSTASAQEKLRFAVGPFQPTATDTGGFYPRRRRCSALPTALQQLSRKAPTKRSHQPQAFEACHAIAADDDVIMHDYA